MSDDATRSHAATQRWAVQDVETGRVWDSFPTEREARQALRGYQDRTGWWRKGGEAGGSGSYQIIPRPHATPERAARDEEMRHIGGRAGDLIHAQIEGHLPATRSHTADALRAWAECPTPQYVYGAGFKDGARSHGISAADEPSDSHRHPSPREGAKPMVSSAGPAGASAPESGRMTPDRVVRMADVLEAVEAAYIKYPGRAKNDKRDHWYASQYKDALVERLRSVPDA